MINVPMAAVEYYVVHVTATTALYLEGLNVYPAPPVTLSFG